MIIPLSVPRPSYASTYPFSIIPLPGKPEMIQLQAHISSLRSDARVKLLVSTKLEKETMGYTYRMSRTSSKILSMKFISSLSMVPAANMFIHIDYLHHCGLSFNDIDNYDMKIPMAEINGILMYKDTDQQILSPKTSKGNTILSPFIMKNQDIILTVSHTYEPFVMFVYGNLHYNAYASSSSIESSNLQFDIDSRLCTKFIHHHQYTELVKSLHALELPSVATLVEQSCTCNRQTHSPVDSVCPTGLLLIYVKNITVSNKDTIMSMDIQAQGEQKEIITTRTPLSFSNAHVKLVHTGTNQELAFQFSYIDTKTENPIEQSFPKEIITTTPIPQPPKPTIIPPIPIEEEPIIIPTENETNIENIPSSSLLNPTESGIGIIEIVLFALILVAGLVWLFLPKTDGEAPVVDLAPNQGQFQASIQQREQAFANFNRTMY